MSTTTAADRRRPDAELASVGRGGLTNLAGTAVATAAGFAVVVVVTRSVPVAAAGLFFEAVALFTMAARMAELGAGTGLVRFIPRQRARGRSGDLTALLWVGLGPPALASALAAMSLAVAAPRIAGALTADAAQADLLVSVLRTLSLFLPAATLTAALAAGTQGLGTMVPHAAIDRIARPAAQLALLLAAAIGGTGLTGMGLAWGLPWLLAAVVLAGWLGRLLGRAGRTSGPPSQSIRTVAAPFWRFTSPRALSGMLQVTLLWVSTLLVGALASPAEAGIYTAATRYLVVGTAVQHAVFLSVQPVLSGLLATGRTGQAREIFQTSAAWVTAASWPLFLIVAAAGPVLLGLFGPQYVAGSTALVVLSLGWLLGTLIGPIDAVLLMGGRSVHNLVNLACALATHLGLSFLLIPRLGMTGAAVAWSASVVVNNLLPLVQVSRQFGIHPFSRRTAVVISLAAGCLLLPLGAVRVTTGSEPVAVTAVALAGMCGYLLSLRRLRGILQLDGLLDDLAARLRGDATTPAPAAEDGEH